MKHVTFADKSLLMGDEAADTLLEYARLLGDTAQADTVTLSAISPDGNVVEASFLLNANTVLMIESTNAPMDSPDNSEAVGEMRERIEAIVRPVAATTEEPWSASDTDIPDVV